MNTLNEKVDIMKMRFFTGRRLYLFEYLAAHTSEIWVFTWFSYLQEWRGGCVGFPKTKWVTNDYGQLVEIVTQVTLH